MSGLTEGEGPPGRPPTGPGHYLRDVIYGALDGVITTFAVISGASGAALEPRIGLVLGVANLVADGISMAASNYLALKSELQQRGLSVRQEKPWRHGLATFLAFVVVGAAPLLAYLLPRPPGVEVFEMALILALLTASGVGALRAPFVRRNPWATGLEMAIVAGIAGGAAYGIGAAVDAITR